MKDSENYQNEYWATNRQPLCFRHIAALQLIKKYEIGSFLDIGCGDGFFIDYARQSGISAEGVEVSDEGYRKCLQKEIIVYQKDILSVNEIGKKFDTITCLDVMEHLFNPSEALKSISFICNTYVIIGVPNFNSLTSRIEVLIGKTPNNNLPKKGHCYWFNKKNLEKIIKTNGLEIVEWRYNTILERYLFTKPLLALFPSLFALSFVVLCKKIR